MPQDEIVITDDNRVQLTQVELDYLESFLDAGDRGGFYLAYHNMTGSVQALEQAKISTFSEEVGGAAFTANTLLQEFFGPQNKVHEQRHHAPYGIKHDRFRCTA